MSKLKALIGLIIILGGSGFAAYQAGILTKPSFGVQDRGDWGDVSQDSIEIVSTAWVNNDNPIQLNLPTLTVSYDLYMNDVHIAEGAKNGVAVKEGNQTVKVRTTAFQNNLPDWWVSHIRNGETSSLRIPIGLEMEVLGYPLEVNGYTHTDTIETDIESIMNDAVGNMEGSYKVADNPFSAEDPRINIVGGSAKWGEVTDSETNIIVNLKIHNPNSYTIPAPGFTGDMIMNDITVADWNANNVDTLEAPEDGTIGPGETKKVKFAAAIDNQKMDDWLTTHVDNGERTDAEIHVKLRFNIMGLEIQLPPGDGMECTFNFRTGILVDDQNSSSQFNGCTTPYIESSGGTDSDSGSDGGQTGSGGDLGGFESLLG